MRPRSRLPLFLLLPSTAFLSPGRAAAADLLPSATRISIAGQARIYRSYGLVRDAEIYAPVGPALEAVGAQVKAGGRDVEVRAGDRTTRWRVQQVSGGESAGDRAIPAPESGEPRALRVRDDLFLPVRAAAELAGHGVVWDEGTRTLSLVPYITRVEVTDGAEGLRLQIAAGGPVRSKPLLLRQPARLVVDFSPALLRLPEGMPAAKGAVRTIRSGQFGPTTVRVVLEADRALTISGLPGGAAKEFAAALSLGPGEAARTASPAVASAPNGEEDASASATQAARPATVKPAPHRIRTVRPKRLASRGNLFHRDPKLLEELRLGGQGVLAGKVICVDAGHGGSDTGAHGLNGLLEKDACLGMALEVARALREAGAAVVLTREEDRALTLDERIDFANSQGCDLFISIHCNAMPRHNTVSGTETYYCTPQSAELAQAIHASIAGFVAERDGGVRTRRFAVIRRTTMPSVLVEVAYIDHLGDEAKLGDPAFRRGVGDAIRDGVIKYCGG
jgi:N-acetylmuramoyl-L-alanine amidase